MTVIVTDTGFGPSPSLQPPRMLDVASDSDPADVLNQIDQVDLVRIDFPSFADGRGFTLARQLRLGGYTGHLRARGHVLSDQYAMARRSGFDDVEISDDLARRQPETDWLARANWQDHNYQSRLRG